MFWLSSLLLALTLARAPATAADYRLPNGMRLILIPHAAATVSIRLFVPAGGRDDPRGLEGLAHYVEHLIAVDRREPDGSRAKRADISLRAHGWSNATTTHNRTVYLMEVAPAALETALASLHQRIVSLDGADSVADRERNVVLREYALRLDNSPITRMHRQLGMRLARIEPSLGLTIGAPETIARFDLAKAGQFWREHYDPRRMVLALSGPIDREAATQAADAVFQKPAAGAAERPVRVQLPRPVQAAHIEQHAADVTPHFTGVRLAFYDLHGLEVADVMRAFAATGLLRVVLTKGYHSVKGLSQATLDDDPDARSVVAWVGWRSRRWLELVVHVEAASAAARKRVLDNLLARIARLDAGAISPMLIEDFRSKAGRPWLVPEDAPHADAVVEWLGLDFTFEQRAAFRTAWRAVGVDSIVDLARRLSRPTLTAHGEVNPRE